MIWRFSNIDWAASAAWAQALLTAGAVFAASWLQDRSVRKNSDAAWHRRLEAAASAARWVWSKYDSMVKAAATDSMDPDRFADLVQPSVLQACVNALSEFPPMEIADAQTSNALLNLRTELELARGKLLAAREFALRTQQAVQASSRLSEHAASIFNAAASIERSVANIVGRSPTL
jgi:hypothetical protein